MRIALEKPGSLVGRVVRADTGAPVPGATLEVASASDARSDADGCFRVASLPPSQYAVRGRAPGLAGESAVLVEKDETAEVMLELHPAATVHGRLELTGGLPCPGGTVHLHSDVLDTGLEAVADSHGEVLFEALLPAKYEVRIDCPGHAEGQVAPPLEVVDAPLTTTFVVRDEPASRASPSTRAETR